MRAALDAERLLGTAVLSFLPFIHPTVWVERRSLSAADGRLMDILREQLACCGPANLTRPECPGCSCTAPAAAGLVALFLVASVAVVAGFALGWAGV